MRLARLPMAGSPTGGKTPTVTSASVAGDGVTVTVVFSRAVTGSTGFSMPGYGALTYQSGSGSTSLLFQSPTTVLQGARPTLGYSPGNVVDLATGRPLAGFAGRTVANGSTQAPATTARLLEGGTQRLLEDGTPRILEA